MKKIKIFLVIALIATVTTIGVSYYSNKDMEIKTVEATLI